MTAPGPDGGTWPGHVLDREDTFPGPDLDRSTWLPHHLPQWSSRAASAARYEVGAGLRLRIDADQEPWCPELDGATIVSSLQTGVRSGPVGSTVGQHRFSPEAVVREEQAEQRLLTPTYGAVAARFRATADPAAMVALWMIGTEDQPEHSAEICVAEIFGRDVGDGGRGRVGMGVHPFGDPTVVDDFEQVPLDLDLTEPHVWAAEWSPGRTVFSVDGDVARTVDQAPAYPVQVMLGLYEFRTDDRDRSAYPKVFDVEWFRYWRPRP